MTDRLECVVPLCRRTTAHPYGEFICGKHWPLLSRAEKARFHRLKRMWRRRAAERRRIRLLIDREWERLKALAIERAFGIG